MYCDSKSIIVISCNPVQHSRTKHINIRYHFIKEHVEQGTIELDFVGMEYELADLFTKALLKERFEYLVHRIDMRCMTPTELERLANKIAQKKLFDEVDDETRESAKKPKSAKQLKSANKPKSGTKPKFAKKIIKKKVSFNQSHVMTWSMKNEDDCSGDEDGINVTILEEKKKVPAFGLDRGLLG
ncbi:hypothetical protein Tco_0531074 [Tanacetum coccineum]